MDGVNQGQEKADELIDSYVGTDYQFQDKFQTREQKTRDCEITRLLRQYVSAYSKKANNQSKYRLTLLIVCASIISLFSMAFLIVLLYYCFNSSEIKSSQIVALITICVSFLSSVLGLLQIITKYCFPTNDEEYITKIVTAIQSNDLSHKIENMKNMQIPTDSSKTK